MVSFLIYTKIPAVPTVHNSIHIFFDAVNLLYIEHFTLAITRLTWAYYNLVRKHEKKMDVRK